MAYANFADRREPDSTKYLLVPTYFKNHTKFVFQYVKPVEYLGTL